jgi:DNA-binding PadR family transcriptional regulator
MRHPFDSAGEQDPRAAFGEGRRGGRGHRHSDNDTHQRGRHGGPRDHSEFPGGGFGFPGHDSGPGHDGLPGQAGFQGFPGQGFPQRGPGQHGPGHRGHGPHDHSEAHFGPPFPPAEGFPPGPGSAFRGGFPPPIPPGGFGFGFGGRGRGRGHGGHGRGRARRGNIRSAVLLLLTERPMHGYEMIQEIAERSGGLWKPSPGSVYPTLQMLADEDLITTDQESTSGKRLYSLTETGTAEAAKQDKTPPWEHAADDVDPSDVALRDALSTLMAATMQVSSTGSSDLRAKAAKILVDSRRQLYLILADAGQEDTDTPEVQDSVPEADES